MDANETFSTPISWDRSAMEWRKMIGSPFCDLTPTQKHILTQTARYGDKWGDDIYPSQRQIALRAGVSTKCVCQTMKRAEAEGWMFRYMLSGGQGYKRTTYELAVPAGVMNVTVNLKNKFWEPPFKYKLVTNGDEKTIIEIGATC